MQVLPTTLTGIVVVDAIVEHLARELADELPGKIHSIYLFGSYVDGSVVAGSDVDLLVVSRHTLTEQERSRLQSLSFGLAAIADRHIDLLCFSRRQLMDTGHWRLEANSRLVAGTDLRPRLPSETLAAYLRRYTHAPYAYMANVLRQSNRLVYPVTPPIAAAEFSGYARTPEARGTGTSIQAFVATVCWIATLLAGIQGGRRVASRHESPAAFRETVGGPWTSFVDDVYRLGKLTWAYRVPESARDRERLRRLTDAMPGFENHYLAVYRAFLLEQLAHPESDIRLQAIDRLREWVVFPDDEVRQAVTAFTRSEDERLRTSASMTLGQMAGDAH